MDNLFSTKMYHGSDLKLKVLKPTAYNAGHRFKKHSWSVFMWPTYDLAYKWAIFVAIRNIIRVYEKKDPSIHCPRGIHKSTGFNSYDFELFMVEENYDFICEKCIGAKAYVYTVDCPIDTNFGFGNNNAQPEYTYDGELKIANRDEITITRRIINKLFDVVSYEEYEKRTREFGKENIRGLLGLIFYPIEEPMHRWKYVYRRIDLKEVKPGDDLDEVMSKYGDEEEMDRVKTAHRHFRTQSLKEGYEPTMESNLLDITFYHGSGVEIKSNTIKANAMMLGNRLEKPSYAVYMWRKKGNAYPWALYNLMQRMCERLHLDCFKKIRLDLFVYPMKINIEESAYDVLRNAVIGKKCYVYECTASITNLGLGHSSYLDEVVSKKDVRITKRETILVTNKFFTDMTNVQTKEWFEDPANKNKYIPKYKGIFTRGLSNLLMYGDDKIFKTRRHIREKLKSGEFKEGDDLAKMVEIVQDEIANESYTPVSETFIPYKAEVKLCYHTGYGPVKKGLPNLIVHKDGKRWRVRSEVLIFKDDKLLLYKDTQINQYGTLYKLPGGGIDDPKESIESAAKRECEEEVRIVPKNIKYKTDYTVLYKKIPEWHKKILHPDGIYYDGAITFVCIAEYDKKYNGYVKKMDRDDTQNNNSRFYSYYEVKDLLALIHRKLFEDYLKHREGDKMTNESFIYEGGSHFVTESSVNKLHIGKGKLDLSTIQFIRAPHTKGGGFCENSLLIKDGKKYRVRAELLIYNDRGQILATKRDKISKYGTWYNLPGGSLEPGKSIEEQAAAEAREEVFAIVDNVKQTGIWFTNSYPAKASVNPKAWDYQLATKYGLDYDGAITILCIGKYSGRYNGKIAEADKVDWGNKAQFYDPDDIKLSKIHRKALAMAHITTTESYINTNRFVTEGIGSGTYDYPLNALNLKKFVRELPALKNAKIGKGYRGLIHAKLEQPVAHPVAFVNIELKTGNIQASHGDPGWIGKAKAKILQHTPHKATKESYDHFVTEGEIGMMKNPYNRFGNKKVTRRVDHKQAVKHPSMIKKYVNSHESYTDFF